MSGMELMRMAVCLGVALLVCVVALACYRHWWVCRMAMEYERCMQDAGAYSTVVVADTTYEELASLDLGLCAFCSMTHFDSRLVHYWRLTVATERRGEVMIQLCVHEMRVLDCPADEAVGYCLRDKLFWDTHCRVCGGRREKGDDWWCQACRNLLGGDPEGKVRERYGDE